MKRYGKNWSTAVIRSETSPRSCNGSEINEKTSNSEKIAKILPVFFASIILQFSLLLKCEIITVVITSGIKNSQIRFSDRTNIPEKLFLSTQQQRVIIPKNGSKAPKVYENGPTLLSDEDLFLNMVIAGDHKHTSEAQSNVIPIVDDLKDRNYKKLLTTVKQTF